MDVLHAYDYAVMRLVPDVRAEAFVNVGVAMHSRTGRFFALRYALPQDVSGLDTALLERFCAGLVRTLDGDASGGPVALLPPSERFHWLTAPRSTVVQFAPVRGGEARDLQAAFEALAGAYLPIQTG